MGISDKVSFFSLYENNFSTLSNYTCQNNHIYDRRNWYSELQKTHSIPIIKQASEIISLSHNMLQRVRFHCGL